MAVVAAIIGSFAPCHAGAAEATNCSVVRVDGIGATSPDDVWLQAMVEKKLYGLWVCV